ncbi:MAG: alpha/beta hydrolase [Erysipelotrichaceae bacterium]|nr:alpha/beta hydrolase [Erysipelotrichaceae bacterium]
MKVNKRSILFASVILLITALIQCGVYITDYYHADRDAIVAFQQNQTVTKQVLSDDTIAYVPDNARQGIIFYPGGKVDTAAYEPLASALSEQNIAVFLVEMPFHLAVLDADAADGIQDQYPDISSWYMAGHSLGGTMAAYYLEEHHESFEGLILLASYSTYDLSQTQLNVLSIAGSEDQVLSWDQYEANKINLPDTMTEIILEGGNHAQFGMYGPQSGDGQALITNEAQIESTVQYILKYIEKEAVNK